MKLVIPSILCLMNVRHQSSMQAGGGPVLVRFWEHLHGLGHKVHERHGCKLAILTDELGNERRKVEQACMVTRNCVSSLCKGLLRDQGGLRLLLN